MNNIDRLIDILKTNNDLDEMYLEAINSQAETLHSIGISLGLLVSAVMVLQLLQIYKLRKIQNKIEGDQHGS